jgi:tetratricopeptide (TPR) repeat protein
LEEDMNERVSPQFLEPVAAWPATDPQAICEHALDLMLHHCGDPSRELVRALAADPSCISAHCLRLALIVRADSDAGRATLVESLSAIEALCPDPTDPARRHAAAAQAWLQGDSALALERYGAIVVDRPRDIVALALSHALDFSLGRRRMLRDRIAQVLPEWSVERPGYASALAMYAFGLEENGQYRQAEKAARRALALDPSHPGAIHVVAHVLEMEGRAREGLAFLNGTEASWAKGTGYSVHLAWHRALFLLDADKPTLALAAYDREIASAREPDMNALADASALLWRLSLRGVETADRWRSLADRWALQPLPGARPFYVMHAIIAFAAARRDAAAGWAFDALPRLGASASSPEVWEDAIAQRLCRALLAFADGAYDACLEGLGLVRHVSDRCGGSVAQCDLVHLTFIEAAVRAGKVRLARALAAERAAQRPASPLNRRLKRRLQRLSAEESRPVSAFDLNSRWEGR